MGRPGGHPDSDLAWVASTGFRTGGLNAGYIVAPPSPVAVPGVPAGNQAKLQLRAWNNQGGTVTSWSSAQANATTVASGASPSFTSLPLGDGGLIPTPSLAGLLSFNIHLTAPSQLTHDWHGIAGGGGTCTGGVFSTSGTIGHYDASDALTGDEYSLTGGFWGVVAAVQTPGAPRLKITRTLTNSVVVWWPLPADGWVLEWTNRVASVSATWPQISLPYQTNTVQAWIVEPAPTGNRFYRLHKP